LRSTSTSSLPLAQVEENSARRNDRSARGEPGSLQWLWGLITSFFLADPAQAQLFRVFFLSCVIVAGLYGAWSVSRGILFVQTLPAALALGVVLL